MLQAAERDGRERQADTQIAALLEKQGPKS
jgi:hypothetical protein